MDLDVETTTTIRAVKGQVGWVATIIRNGDPLYTTNILPTEFEALRQALDMLDTYIEVWEREKQPTD